MLSALLAYHRPQLVALADAWLAAGATSMSVWNNGQLIAQWPDGGPPEAPGLRAPIRAADVTIGELCVAGVAGGATEARLDAEAALLSRLATLETELEGMTIELIDRQDQLLALYDLTQSTRNHLDVDGALRSVAREAARLSKTQGGFALLVPPLGQATVAQYPPSMVEDAVWLGFFHEIQPAGNELLLNADSAGRRLPPSVRNMFLTPIQIRGETVAGLGLFNKPDGDFTSPDLKLARAIADQAGAQLENILLYQENLEQAKWKAELDVAARIQLRLLPQTIPAATGIDWWAHSRPALQVGGDFYDFVARAGRPIFFAVGDVAGKGMSAALLMSITHTALHNAARFMPSPTPESVIRRGNVDLYDDLTEVGMFVTVFVGRYDGGRQELVYANAGHSPVIYCPRGGSARILEADGGPLGVLPDSFSENQVLPFRAGDLLLVATDGFSEARNSDDELFGYNRLLRLVESLAEKSAREIADGLFDAVTRFGSGQAQDDDQTLLVMKGVAQ